MSQTSPTMKTSTKETSVEGKINYRGKVFINLFYTLISVRSFVEVSFTPSPDLYFWRRAQPVVEYHLPPALTCTFGGGRSRL